jgi:type I restriction enzyme S subunit
MKMKSESLKPGWRRAKFGDVVRLWKARSQDPLADGIERYVGLEHLEPGDLRIRRWGNVADGVTFTAVFQPGQVLFGKRRAYQRKVAMADRKSNHRRTIMAQVLGITGLQAEPA